MEFLIHFDVTGMDITMMRHKRLKVCSYQDFLFKTTTELRFSRFSSIFKKRRISMPTFLILNDNVMIVQLRVSYLKQVTQ